MDKYFDFYLGYAARNRGWDLSILSDNKPYLYKFTKNGRFFYTPRIFNFSPSGQSELLSANKNLLSSVLTENQVPCVETFIVNLINIDELYEMLAKTYDQFVVKPNKGHASESVQLFTDKQQIVDFLSVNKQRTYCISGYFEHDIELRFVIFENKLAFINPKYLTRKVEIAAEETHLFIPLSTLRKMKNTAIQAAKLLNYPFIAVDILVKGDTFKIIETNTHPGLNAYSKISKRKEQNCIKLYEKMFDLKEEDLKRYN